MRVLIAVLFLTVAIASAQEMQCTPLFIDDVTCEGFRGNFPQKVCSFRNGNMPTSSMFCDLKHVFKVWLHICPLRNVNDTQMFCEGRGFVGPDDLHSLPCFGLNGCETDEECNIGVSPAVPAPKFKKYCASCCHRCFGEEMCEDKVLDLPWYTNSTDCSPCNQYTDSATPPEGLTTSPAKNENESGSVADLDVAPWIYGVIAGAIAVPIVITAVLLYRYKRIRAAPKKDRKYGELDEEN